MVQGEELTEGYRTDLTKSMPGWLNWKSIIALAVSVLKSFSQIQLDLKLVWSFFMQIIFILIVFMITACGRDWNQY